VYGGIRVEKHMLLWQNSGMPEQLIRLVQGISRISLSDIKVDNRSKNSFTQKLEYNKAVSYSHNYSAVLEAVMSLSFKDVRFFDRAVAEMQRDFLIIRLRSR